MSILVKKIINKNQNVVKSAFLMSLGTFISRILGLFRDIIIAYFFSRTETDAFFVAFRLPNFFRRFLGEGALSVSFIPIFIQLLSDSSKEDSQVKAQNLINSIYTILLVCVSVFTVLGIIFMEPLLGSFFSGTAFSAIDSKVQMTVYMAQILFGYLFLVTLYAYFMGISNALGYFFIPAMAPAFLNIFMIIFSFFPKNIVDFPPLLLCWGVIAGGIVQIIVTAGLLIKLGFFPKVTFCLSVKDLKRVAYSFFPSIVGIGGFAIIGILNLYFAAWLEEGTHTYIYYGDRLLELPRSLIAISMGTALLPSLSYLFAQNKKNQMLQTAANQRDLLLFLILPCSVAFYYLSVPIVEVLFQRGKFDIHTVQKTATILQIYSLLLISSSLSRVLATGFYAIKNTWYPAICSALYVLFHWFFTPYMMENFDLEGLIMATVISNGFFMFLLMGGYSFFVGRLYLLRTLKRFLYSLPVLVIFALYCNFSFSFLSVFLNSFINKNHVSTWALLLVIISSIVLYFSLGALLRVPQALELLNMILKKIKKNTDKSNGAKGL